MNTRQIQYAVQLAELKSFSLLADKLSISQPALSKQIKILETELGIKLFNRGTVPLQLTPAGEFFVREAKTLLYGEQQLVSSMQQFKSGKSGKLTIGISPSKNQYLMPSVLKAVRDRFSGVQISLCEARSDVLRKEAAEGKYAFAILNCPVDDTIFDYIPIQKDELVLAVPNSLLEKIDKAQPIEFKSCKSIPFVTVGKGQELRDVLDILCRSAGFNPFIAVEVNGGIITACALMTEGLGATILPIQFAEKECKGKPVTLFPIKEKVSTRQPAVVIKKGQYISECARFAIEKLTNIEDSTAKQFETI